MLTVIFALSPACAVTVGESKLSEKSGPDEMVPSEEILTMKALPCEAGASGEP
jgi:hypothetical protein